MKNQQMSYNRTIHIVSHTHWDREWYFSTSDSLVLLDQTFSDILNELNVNENVNFCFDGQVSILEDYLKLYPEKLENIKELVHQKRLTIGPWYTQTDTQLVCGQSIVENLYHGIYRTKKLVEDYMKVGYLPDTFGFCNQMPMIMRQFGIDNFIFWRGADFDKQKIEPYFNWIGQDQSVVTGVVLHNGYGMAKGLSSSDDFVNYKLNPLIEEYKKLTKSEHILIPMGNDQNNIVIDLDKKLQDISDDLKISSYESFVSSLQGQKLPSYCGEFREVKTSRIHKSCGGVRMDIKMSNYIAEQALIKTVQPLQVMAKMEGIEVSENLIQEAWKLLFAGQAHDGIVGCVSDSVAQDIVSRNKQALEIANSSSNYMKKHFARRMNTTDDEVIIFNLEPSEFCGYKEVDVFSYDEHITFDDVTACTIIETKTYKGYENALVETPIGNHYEVEQDYYLHKILINVTLPSFGYKVLKFHRCDANGIHSIDCQYIKNENYKISFINHQVKVEYEGNEINDFISLWDMGNDGDTYDFSPLQNDEEVRLTMHEAHVLVDDEIQVMKITCTAQLPSTLDNRRNKVNDSVLHCQIELRLKKDDMINVHVNVENTILSHRLRFAIRGLQKIDKTLAATPFGSVARDVITQKDIEGWQTTHVECPIDIETNSGFVSVLAKGKQLVVLNKGVKEYQANEDRIFMTLFSSCGELGKPDLLYRPGRASGDTTKKGHIRMETPLAQVLGTHEFEFAIVFAKNDDATLCRYLNDFEAPSVFYQNQKMNLFYERIDNKIQFTEIHEDSLPNEMSYFQLDEKLFVSSIYSSLYDGSMQIRFQAFEHLDKTDIYSTSKFQVGNLLEQGDTNRIEAYRLYTLRGENHENK